MKHQMHLRARSFDQVRSGDKTVEVRLLDEKRRSLSVGDEIAFIHNEDSAQRVTKLIVELHSFTSFAELLKSVELGAMGFEQDTTTAQAREILHITYPPAREIALGVLGIVLE